MQLSRQKSGALALFQVQQKLAATVYSNFSFSMFWSALQAALTRLRSPNAPDESLMNGVFLGEASEMVKSTRQRSAGKKGLASKVRSYAEVILNGFNEHQFAGFFHFY